MPTKKEYIESLIWRLNSIKQEISEHQIMIQEMFKLVELKQEQAKNIMMLLKSEDSEIVDPELTSITNIAVADAVYELLETSGDKKPVHYNDLTQKILSKGILIPGKNPAANLLSHISRDERFVRTAPGTYGLKAWGLKPLLTRKNKSSTRRKKNV